MISRIVLILAAAALLAGCGATGNSDGRPTVLAAFYPLAYAAERIGGGRYDIENLTPPGVEPHDLELAPKTVARIVHADFVLYLGHDFQPAVASAADQSQGQALDVSEGDDPHIWLDPVLFSGVARKIARLLHAPAGPLLADLKRLDREYRNGLRQCARRSFVTSHAAFGYLTRRYGLRQIAITGLTPEVEPTARDLDRVVRLVRRTHTSTVFFERLVSPRLARTVAREVGARTAVLDPIEGTSGPSYLDLMGQNLRALRQALGCR